MGRLQAAVTARFVVARRNCLNLIRGSRRKTRSGAFTYATGVDVWFRLEPVRTGSKVASWTIAGGTACGTISCTVRGKGARSMPHGGA